MDQVDGFSCAPPHPTGGGATFCVRLGMYVSPRVKILGVGHPHPRAGTMVRGAVCGLGVQESGWGIYSTLNLKNAALSAGVNSRQMLPSTTDKESGVIVYLIRPQ